MDDYLKIEIVDGKLSIQLLREITPQDFAVVAKTNDEGIAVSFIEALAEESPWTFTRGEISHTGFLRIAFCYAPQVREKLSPFLVPGMIDQYMLVYLIDLFKVYEEVLEVPIKGRTEKAKEKAYEELQALSQRKEQELFERAASHFNKAILMIQAM